MNLSNLSKKEKLGLIIGVIFLFFALLDRMIVGPINARIKKIDRQIKLSEKQVILEMRNVGQKDLIEKAFNKYISLTGTKGSDEEKIASMLTLVEDLRKDSGVSLLDIKPQVVKTTEFYKEFTLSMEVETTMDALVNFLYKLNHSAELLRVESLQLNLKDKNSTTLKASIFISKIVLL